MSSWADDVRAYEAAKRTTPGPTQRVQVASQKERLSKERDYNPLAGKYRDPERESSTRKAEQSRLDRQQAMTLTRAVKYDAPYNILNGNVNRGFPEPARAPTPKWRREAEAAELNRVPTPTSLPCYTDRVMHDEDQTPFNRNYNIITGRFTTEDHDARVGREEKQFLTTQRKKFLDLFPYDPIRAVWNDNNREDHFHAEQEQERKEKLVRNTAQLPKLVRTSEGMLYNILSLQEREVVLEEQALLLAQKKAIPPPCVAVLFEEKVHSRGEQQSRLSRTRTNNRVNRLRYIENTKFGRGYNMITNQQMQFKEDDELTRHLALNAQATNFHKVHDAHVHGKRVVEGKGDEKNTFINFQEGNYPEPVVVERPQDTQNPGRTVIMGSGITAAYSICTPTQSGSAQSSKRGSRRASPMLQSVQLSSQRASRSASRSSSKAPSQRSSRHGTPIPGLQALPNRK